MGREQLPPYMHLASAAEAGVAVRRVSNVDLAASSKGSIEFVSHGQQFD